MLVLTATAASADRLESLHIFNFDVNLTKRAMLQFHGRFRTGDNFRHVFQARGGPLFYYKLAPRFTAIAGFYAIEQYTVDDSFNQHRLFAGGQTRVVEKKHWTLDHRFLFERFVAGPTADFSRVRNRLMLASRGWRLNPYVSGEALWVERARTIGRYTAGVQFRAGRLGMLSTGYEYREAVRGGPSHVIATTLQIVLRKPRE